MMNLDELIETEKKKHAAKLKRLRAKAAKEEQDLLLRVARLLKQNEPERFAQYSEEAARLIKKDRDDRSERAKEGLASGKQQDGTSDAAAPAGDGGGY
ncbi:hypothetical protein CJ193_008955 [Pseudoglutamicibacter albus]|uniref:Uncharacterized protein n=1 Tax=Pseudoglutamicibacter cumminsii TaxID=156979 RepID=A0AAP4C6L9_9MICC|nr:MULTISPECIES: hypothetical protein [Pseudoglutamicibacter]MDK6274405.1 hypothetical protein [Pseudoglutamicibacter cumminsii]PKY81161.1 hypothetical protein CYJ35_01710 [Pseudoglutamicibacter albus]WIK84188.1 hypothetical protein CJ193_008955 [Pseudoglutamicibacter albus]